VLEGSPSWLLGDVPGAGALARFRLHHRAVPAATFYGRQNAQAIPQAVIGQLITDPAPLGRRRYQPALPQAGQVIRATPDRARAGQGLFIEVVAGVGFEPTLAEPTVLQNRHEHALTCALSPLPSLAGTGWERAPTQAVALARSSEPACSPGCPASVNPRTSTGVLQMIILLRAVAGRLAK
jgi:hypothetical protein